jgi:hypothetical protein
MTVDSQSLGGGSSPQDPFELAGEPHPRLARGDTGISVDRQR